MVTQDKYFDFFSEVGIEPIRDWRRLGPDLVEPTPATQCKRARLKAGGPV